MNRCPACACDSLPAPDTQSTAFLSGSAYAVVLGIEYRKHLCEKHARRMAIAVATLESVLRRSSRVVGN